MQTYADHVKSIGDHVQETTSRSLDTAGLVKLLKLKYMNKYVEMAWHELKWFENDVRHRLFATHKMFCDLLRPHIAAVPDPESCNSKRLSADCTGSTSHVWLEVDAASIFMLSTLTLGVLHNLSTIPTPTDHNVSKWAQVFPPRERRAFNTSVL